MPGRHPGGREAAGAGGLPWRIDQGGAVRVGSTRPRCLSQLQGPEHDRGERVTRLPLLAFAALVVATVAAFFITQHLKVSTPLLAGFPRPVPAAINPVGGINCYDPAVGKRLDYRQMSISFYLLNQSDSVDVWVVDARGRIVATLARGRYMPGGSHPVRKQFVWNGRESDGAVAPD